MFLRQYILFLFATVFIGMSGATLDDAKAMYLDGNYAEALPIFELYLADSPKDASLNHWTGVCLMKAGHYAEAIPLLEFAEKRGVIEAPRYLAEIAMNEYRLDDAEAYIESYKKTLKKNKRTMPKEAEEMVQKLDRIATMLERVEKIVIIDSLTVNATDFFKFYRLSSESGSLNGTDLLPIGTELVSPTVVYRPEIGSQLFWAAPDSDDYSILVSMAQLVDGSWENPHSLGENLNEGGNANYPFLMPDGVTLYFANDGDNSIGGYDIFISRKGDDEQFLQPQNIGMPYNSPYNDYMLAIDELTGVGWWATDRNHIDGKVTIYKFIPNEMRINYDVDDPHLAEFARITSIKDTWEADADYGELLRAIDAIDASQGAKTELFHISMPNGCIYTDYDDFHNKNAKVAMQDYVDELQQFESSESHLSDLRKRYANGDRSVSSEILSIEQQQLSDRTMLQQMLNNVIRLEMNYK